MYRIRDKNEEFLFVCVFFPLKAADKLWEDDSLLLFEGHLDFLFDFGIGLLNLFDPLVVLILLLLEF